MTEPVNVSGTVTSTDIDSSLLFFFLILVVLFNRCGWFEKGNESLLFFFLLLVVLFNGGYGCRY